MYTIEAECDDCFLIQDAPAEVYQIEGYGTVAEVAEGATCAGCGSCALLEVE